MAQRIILQSNFNPPDPDGGRRQIPEKDWQMIKDLVDCYREGLHDAAVVRGLEHYHLWDTEYECLDEDKVTRLYMSKA